MAKKKAAAAGKKAPSKSEIFAHIAEKAGISRKQVKSVFEALSDLVAKNIKKNGFTVPGLAKISIKRIPAKPARKGINPFTGQEQMFKAKPARNKVVVRPIKALKDMA